jgi:hypothetical protein
MRGVQASARVCLVGRTVLIVDDHEGFRAVARALLDAAGFEVVGEAGDGASALAACCWTSTYPTSTASPSRSGCPPTALRSCSPRAGA